MREKPARVDMSEQKNICEFPFIIMLRYDVICIELIQWNYMNDKYDCHMEIPKLLNGFFIFL